MAARVVATPADLRRLDGVDHAVDDSHGQQRRAVDVVDGRGVEVDLFGRACNGLDNATRMCYASSECTQMRIMTRIINTHVLSEQLVHEEEIMKQWFGTGM